MKKSITVKAPQKEVWEALLSYRHSEPSKRKVVSSTDEKAVIEEDFGGVPVVGNSKVVYSEKLTPYERVDFQLVESKQVNVFEGTIILEPSKDGHSTVVEITTKLDSPLPIPFKDQILSAQAGSDMQKRLDYIKKTAEKR